MSNAVNTVADNVKSGAKIETAVLEKAIAAVTGDPARAHEAKQKTDQIIDDILPVTDQGESHQNKSDHHHEGKSHHHHHHHHHHHESK